MTQAEPQHASAPEERPVQPPSGNSKRIWKQRSCAVLIGLALCLGLFLVGEISIRIYGGNLTNFESTLATAPSTLSRADYHPRLGYVPRSGQRVTHFTSNVDEQSIRKNAAHPETKGLLILAAGDSYTFGDCVDDDATWPSHLEGILSRPVLNGGVFGYGIDQTVLRMEELVSLIRPRVVVLSLIADDLERAEHSYRYAWKPYFSLQNGALQLENVPVPQHTSPVPLSWLRTALSYSRLAHAACRRSFPYWWKSAGKLQRALNEGQGQDVACLLMKRVSTFAVEHDLKIMIVAQCDKLSFDNVDLDPVLQAARDAGLETLDVTKEMQQLVSARPGLKEEYYMGDFGGHMTSAGNRWVAERIAQKLQALGW